MLLQAGSCPSALRSGLRPQRLARVTPLVPSLRRCTRAVIAAAQKAAFSSGPYPIPEGPASHYYRETESWPTEETLPLQQHNLEQQPYVDLIVAGAGPAGVAAAGRVAAAGFSVCVIDPEPLAHWPNNYGVWLDEFQAMGLEDSLHVIWPKAKVWLNSLPDGEKFLNRPFARVDRPKLKRMLLERCNAAGVTFLYGKVSGCCHGEGSSEVQLADGRKIRGSLVLDATGHSRRLVEYDKKFDPGFQGAYGIVAEVESHPFDIDTMLFMDWRDEHTHGPGLEAMRAANEKLPTFLYAMPFTKNKVFLEETSLVSRPAVGFPELKERLEARLKWLGIKVTRVEEEEYCLIPMGGVLPKHPQRVLALGGTAGMVHPSTGFMIYRMMSAAPTVADAIIDQLSCALRPADESEAVSMANAVWRATWPVERVRQRAFFTFGMDVLLSLDLYEMREFFRAFFSLSSFHWHGFLSTRLSFPQLIVFGLSLFLKSSNAARSSLLLRGIPGLLAMLVELVPTLGGASYYPGMTSLKERKDAVDAAARQAAAATGAAVRQPLLATAGAVMTGPATAAGMPVGAAAAVPAAVVLEKEKEEEASVTVGN
ncbi:hypothetical protein VOLCADRAFT_107605 [Volvox carteri f. nagariensis]|uniref:lycopene beta-cyclase n=1 Tax=Volvox carteri f. nagariensis TaxID=3068 RepID=D8UF32_VOLCA|nr:uncharacterized protein VOLCADRAFT_107605 [Volvox carteri f. nagariensis]EFJ41647.1 hypothetical protein VOLCADRAFT_107605 [Volvox carteri f. nagariensis]|eukprot:XP_002957303.1 hypothetical protein VOLCADRAFT_107605 [Volvox carteri f. nagariensis]